MTTILVCICDELRAVILLEEGGFNYPDRANELYLWVVLRAYRIMLEFVKENFTGHPKFHP